MYSISKKPPKLDEKTRRKTIRRVLINKKLSKLDEKQRGKLNNYVLYKVLYNAL